MPEQEKRVGCDCVDKVQEQLRELGGYIDTVSLTNLNARTIKEVPRIHIYSYTKKRPKGLGSFLVYRYCPMCGNEYEPKQEGLTDG